MEPYYQGAKDVFLAKVRADFDSVENQAMKSISSLESNNLLRTEQNTNALFTQITNITDEGDRAVWRHVSATGVQQLGERKAGGQYPTASFLRGYETAVFNPDLEDAAEFNIPEERQDSEGKKYKTVLDRAQKLVIETRRKNMNDAFDVFNYAFTAASSQATRFFVKGNAGLDGNQTALGERLISIQHARADAGSTISNAVQTSGNAAPFTDTYYWAALEQGFTFKDDVGKPMPMFGGALTIVTVNNNSQVRVAKEINESEWKTGTANNDVNIFQGNFRSIVTSPYLLTSYNLSTASSDNKKWFLVDTVAQDPQVGTGLVRVCFLPTNSRVERYQPTDSIVYKIKQSYVYGFADWRNVIGSKGDSAAYTA